CSRYAGGYRSTSVILDNGNQLVDFVKYHPRQGLTYGYGSEGGHARRARREGHVEAGTRYVNRGSRADRRGAPLQPLLHARDRRAGAGSSAQRVLARGGAAVVQACALERQSAGA